MPWRRFAVACAVALTTGAAWAQGAGLSLGEPVATQTLRADVLVLDFDRLFSESAYGQRVTAEIEATGADIAAENRRIEADLTEEERQLTEQRDTMAPDAFRALADAFDEKVQALRRSQDAKARALGQRGDEARRVFLGAVEPILLRLMDEAGAQVILESRTVFAARDTIDVTDRAIAEVNRAIEAGTQLDP